MGRADLNGREGLVCSALDASSGRIVVEVRVCACVRVYVCMCVCICTHTHIHTHKQTGTHTQKTHTYTHTNTHIHTHKHTQVEGEENTLALRPQNLQLMEIFSHNSTSSSDEKSDFLSDEKADSTLCIRLCCPGNYF